LIDVSQLRLRACHIAESPPCLGLRFFARRSRRHEFGDTLLEVKRQLVIHVSADVAATEVLQVAPPARFIQHLPPHSTPAARAWP
jgi:hypothetical protein